MSTIYDAAIEYQKLMRFEYKLVFGYKGNNFDIPLRFYEDKFFHLSGLQYLNDVSKIMMLLILKMSLRKLLIKTLLGVRNLKKKICKIELIVSRIYQDC